MLLRGACGGGCTCRWTQETQLANSPVHADRQAGRETMLDWTASTSMHGTGEQQQQQKLGRGDKVTLGARMQRCKTRHTHPGPPGPTFAGRAGLLDLSLPPDSLLLAVYSERLPIDTGKEPFARTGGTTGSSHMRVVHMHLVECCRPCLLLLISYYRCLPPFSARCLCSPSPSFALIACQSIFSETLAAFRHSLAMTSSPIPPQAHYYGIEPPLVSSARSRLVGN